MTVSKVVLLGSSTGANVIMRYLSRRKKTKQDSRYPLDAAVLQDPVSDQYYINWYAANSKITDLLANSRTLAEFFVDAGRW